MIISSPPTIVTGTTNQVNTTGSVGRITLSLPQDIATSSSPTFAGLDLGIGSITMTGSLGATGARLTKGWFTDLQVTNAISGSITGNAATVTTNANLTGVITSVGNATSIASQTGTGTKFVVDTSPTLVTPTLGVATATSLSTGGLTLTGDGVVTSGSQISWSAAPAVAPVGTSGGFTTGDRLSMVQESIVSSDKFVIGYVDGAPSEVYIISAKSNSASGGAIAFYTQSSGTAFGKRMHISSTGISAGSSVNNTYGVFQLNGAPTAGGAQFSFHSDSGANTSYAAFLGTNSTGAGMYLTIGDSSVTETYYAKRGHGVIAGTTGSALYFNTNAVDGNALYIGTDQKVGIGTAAPGSLLDVAGSFQCDSIVNDTGLAAGVYTPTSSNLTNVDAATTFEFQYMRVGNTVTVSGQVNVDPTATGSGRFDLTLPVASTFGANTDASGVAASNTTTNTMAIYAVTSTQTVRVQGIFSHTSNEAYFLTFTYQVI